MLSVVLKREFGFIPASWDAIHGSVFRVLMNPFQDSEFWGTRWEVRGYGPDIEQIQAIPKIGFWTVLLSTRHHFKNDLCIMQFIS